MAVKRQFQVENFGYSSLFFSRNLGIRHGACIFSVSQTIFMKAQEWSRRRAILTDGQNILSAYITIIDLKPVKIPVY